LGRVHKDCVVLASNRAQIGYAEFVAWQIRQAGASDLPIFIASADASQQDLQHDVAKILPIEIADFIAALPQVARLKEYTYWRLPAIAAAAQDFDRVLYLDTDFFVCGADFRTIFDIDLRGAPIAAVRDAHQSARPKRCPNEFRILDIANAPYFNAGLLLVDGRAFTDGGCIQQIEQIATARSHALTAHDQSVLNILFHANWLEISPVWNWQFSYRHTLYTPYLDLELLHLAGRVKPWNDTDLHVPAIVSATYRRFVGAHPPSGAIHNATLSWASLAKHLWYRTRYQAWLDRFPDKYEGQLARAF